MFKTLLGNSYWTGTGAYQELYSSLLQLLPEENEGIADTLHQELTRCIACLLFEYHEEGNRNSRLLRVETEYTPYYDIETDEDFDMENDVICGVSITTDYEYFIGFIESNVPEAVYYTVPLRNLLTECDDMPEPYTPDRINVYDSLVDCVMEFISTTDDIIF